MSNNETLPRGVGSEPKPVRLLYSVAAAFAALTTVLAAIDGVPRWLVAAIAGVSVVLTAGLGRWVQGQTAPWANVKALYIDESGKTVAGPAAELKTGTVVEEPVAVGPSPYSP